MNFSISPLSVQQLQRPFLSTGSSALPEQLPGFGPAYEVNLSAAGHKSLETETSDHAAGGPNGTKKVDGTECQTCKERKYQDGSNETNVSFKSPGHVDPGNSASAVMSHEQEHVSNARAEAARDENKRLVNCSVRLYTATCPECGRLYTAGGETTTTMRTAIGNGAKDSDRENALGNNVDIAA